MPRYRLDTGFAIEGGASGARRIVHLVTGKTLELSEDEALVLVANCDLPGRQEPSRPVPDSEAGRAFLRDLVVRGVLVAAESAAKRDLYSTPHLAGRPPMLLPARAAAEGVSAHAAPPKEGTETSDAGRYARLELEDALPLFRPDIQLTRRPSEGLFDAVDPKNGRSFPLYDFEVSVARMLKRNRTVADLMAACSQLGIPVTLSSFRQFLRELDRYGFLVPGKDAHAEPQPPSRAPATSTASPHKATAAPVLPALPDPVHARPSWNPDVQALFQSGVRALRQGKREESVQAFESVLTRDANHSEARELLAQARRLPSADQPLAPDSAPPAGPALATPDRSRTLRWGPWLQPVVGLTQRHPKVAYAGLGVLGLALCLAPLLFSRPSAAEGDGRAEGPPALAAYVGDVGENGPERRGGARRTLARVERVWRPYIGEVTAPAKGIVRWSRAANAPVGSEQRLGTVQLRGEDDVHYVVAKEHLDTLKRQKRKGAAHRRKVQEAQRTLAALRRELDRGVPIHTPVGGILDFAVESRALVDEGATVARIFAPDTWHLGGTVTDLEPRPGDGCRVSTYGTGQVADCALVEVRPSGAGYEVVAEVDIDQAPWLPVGSPGSIRLSVEQK